MAYLRSKTLMPIIELLVFLFVTVLLPGHTKANVPYQYQISNYLNLISSYDYEDTYSTVDLIPLVDASRVMYVTLGMSFFAINDFDEVAGSIEIVGALSMKWTDETPTINSFVFSILDDSEDFFLVPPDMIWTPNLVLTNAVGATGKVGSSQFMAVFNMTTSEVNWKPRVIMTASCTPDVTFYPFDKQSCEFTFTPWEFRSDEITLISVSDSWDMSQYSESGEWDVLDTTAETSFRNGQSYITFKIALLRKPLYASFNILLPVLILCGLNSVVFLLPAESGERVGFSITLFLSFMVFLNTVMDFMPRSSSPVSYLCFYLVLMMCNSAGMTLVTVLMLRVYHKSEKSKVPKWLSWCVNFINCGCAKLRCCVIMCRCLKDNVCTCKSNSNADDSEEDSKICCERICRRRPKCFKNNTSVKPIQTDNTLVHKHDKDNEQFRALKFLSCFRNKCTVIESGDKTEADSEKQKKETSTSDKTKTRKQDGQIKSKWETDENRNEGHNTKMERKPITEQNNGANENALNERMKSVKDNTPTEQTLQENIQQNGCNITGIFKCIARRQGLESVKPVFNEQHESTTGYKDANSVNNRKRKFKSDVIDSKITAGKAGFDKSSINQSLKNTYGDKKLDKSLGIVKVGPDAIIDKTVKPEGRYPMEDNSLIEDIIEGNTTEHNHQASKKEGKKTGTDAFERTRPTENNVSIAWSENKSSEGKANEVKPDTSFLEYLLKCDSGDSGVGSTLISENDTAENGSLDIFRQYRDSSSEESDGETISVFSERPLSRQMFEKKKVYTDSDRQNVLTDESTKVLKKSYLKPESKEYGLSSEKDRKNWKEAKDATANQSTELIKRSNNSVLPKNNHNVKIVIDTYSEKSTNDDTDTESLDMFRQFRDSSSDESDGETVSIFSSVSRAELMKKKRQTNKGTDETSCNTEIQKNPSQEHRHSDDMQVSVNATHSDLLLAHSSNTSVSTAGSGTRGQKERVTPAGITSKKSKIAPIIITNQAVIRNQMNEGDLKKESTDKHKDTMLPVTVSVKKQGSNTTDGVRSKDNDGKKKITFSFETTTREHTPSTIHGTTKPFIDDDEIVRKTVNEKGRRYSMPLIKPPIEMPRRHSVAYIRRPSFDDDDDDDDDGLNPDVEWADVGRVLDFFFFLAFLALQIFLTVVFFIPIATSTSGSEEA